MGIKKVSLDSADIVSEIMSSPIFSSFSGGNTNVQNVNLTEMETLYKDLSDNYEVTCHRILKYSFNDCVITDDYIKKVNDELSKNGVNVGSTVALLTASGKMESFYAYYKVIDTYYGSTMSVQDKCNLILPLMSEDIKNNYSLLSSIPILRNGELDFSFGVTIQVMENGQLVDKEVSSTFDYNGEYLEFFNPYGENFNAPLNEFTSDTKGNIYSNPLQDKDGYLANLISYYKGLMNVSGTYSDKFRNQVFSNTKSFSLVNANFSHDWAAFARDDGVVSSDVVLDVGQIYNCNPQAKTDMTNFMINSFTHELGHVFANASSGGIQIGVRRLFENTDIDETDDWISLYNYILSNYPSDPYDGVDSGPLRDYAFHLYEGDEHPYELFAECVAEYYAYGNSSVYNPNDLKTIDVPLTSNYSITLYDVMDGILK